MATGDDWMLQWQEIEKMMRRLRLKEKSTTDPVDSRSQLTDLQKDPKERTLLIKIHLQRYLISWEELDRVFARVGTIEYIEVFCSGGDYHSSIRFQDREAAFKAFESFNGRHIYDNCCRMELFLDANFDGSESKIETTNQKTLEELGLDEQGLQMLDSIASDELQSFQEEVETSVATADAPLANAIQEIEALFISEVASLKESNEPFLDDEFIADATHSQSKSSWKVIVDSLDLSIGLIGIESIEESRWANLKRSASSCLRTFSAQGIGQELIAVVDCKRLHPGVFDLGDGGCEFRGTDFRRILAIFFENSTEDHVFEGMPKQSIVSLTTNEMGSSIGIEPPLLLKNNTIFDPGIASFGIGMGMPKCLLNMGAQRFKLNDESGYHCGSEMKELISLPYDRGEKFLMLKLKEMQIDVSAMTFVFDPGGSSYCSGKKCWLLC